MSTNAINKQSGNDLEVFKCQVTENLKEFDGKLKRIETVFTKTLTQLSQRIDKLEKQQRLNIANKTLQYTPRANASLDSSKILFQQGKYAYAALVATGGLQNYPIEETTKDELIQVLIQCATSLNEEGKYKEAKSAISAVLAANSDEKIKQDLKNLLQKIAKNKALKIEDFETM
ncbi:MAG: hypothetical protein K1000chlam3_00297 [Chlamydiae bacterium]|nr:hypothetical protein [Chlamydiota bacterium]